MHFQRELAMAMFKKLVRKVVPKPVRRAVNQRLGRLKPQTVAQGWDKFATSGASDDQAHVGDQWNTPEQFGVKGVSPEEYPAFLDKHFIRPFFGDQCGVMLEIGPGGGRFTSFLIDRCTRIIAADTSPAMLKLLKKRFEGDGRLQPILLDGSGVPQVADRSLDTAFSWGVFVHLQHWDVFNYFTELKRTLKPGGKAIIQTANMDNDFGWQKFLKDLPTSLNRHKRPGSFSVMTPELMRMFIERAGLTAVDVVTGTIPRDCVALIQAP